MALVNLKEMLADAAAKHYAVGMFDVSDLEMIRSVVEEADALKSPVILGALAPDLEGDRLDYWFALTRMAAEKASVPVCIHLDHANTLDEVMRAANIGFSSVMLDASSSEFDENIRRILYNAVVWAQPSCGPHPTLGHFPVPLERVTMADHSDEYHP